MSLLKGKEKQNEDNIGGLQDFNEVSMVSPL